MAQFSLPQNSKIEVGDYFKDKTNSKNLRKINVYRWDPSTGKILGLIHMRLIWITGSKSIRYFI